MSEKVVRSRQNHQRTNVKRSKKPFFASFGQIEAAYRIIKLKKPYKSSLSQTNPRVGFIKRVHEVIGVRIDWSAQSALRIVWEFWKFTNQRFEAWAEFRWKNIRSTIELKSIRKERTKDYNSDSDTKWAFLRSTPIFSNESRVYSIFFQLDVHWPISDELKILSF